MRPARNPPLLTTSPVGAIWPVFVSREYVRIADGPPMTTQKRSPTELLTHFRILRVATALEILLCCRGNCAPRLHHPTADYISQRPSHHPAEDISHVVVSHVNR